MARRIHAESRRETGPGGLACGSVQSLRRRGFAGAFGESPRSVKGLYVFMKDGNKPGIPWMDYHRLVAGLNAQEGGLLTRVGTGRLKQWTANHQQERNYLRTRHDHSPHCIQLARTSFILLFGAAHRLLGTISMAVF